MCFSAAASFTAGAVLSSTGAVTITKARTRRELPFASIPLLFGIQQALEGVVWLSPASGLYHGTIYSYLFFAYCLWPFLIPFSAWCLEKDTKRKKYIGGILILGSLVSLYFFYFLITSSIEARVVGRSLSYSLNPPLVKIAIIAYVIAVVAGGLLSSRRALQVFSFFLIPSLAIASLANYFAAASVWCFFAAILSGVIVWDGYVEARKRN